MEHSTRQKISTLAAISLAALLFSGCGSTKMYVQPSRLESKPADTARIHLHRKKNMIGSRPAFIIIDEGTGIAANGQLALGEMRSYFPSYLAVKDAPKALIGHSDCITGFDENGDIVRPDKAGEYTLYSEFFNKEDRFTYRLTYPPFACGLVETPKEIEFRLSDVMIIGQIKNGDTIVWDRPPGNVNLTVINNSTQKYTIDVPPLTVEAGKEYYLELRYKFYGWTSMQPPFEVVVVDKFED